MAVAAVAAPMVMALGVVTDRAEMSRWVLLSSPLSPGQTGEQRRQTLHTRVRNYVSACTRTGNMVHVAY